MHNTIPYIYVGMPCSSRYLLRYLRSICDVGMYLASYLTYYSLLGRQIGRLQNLGRPDKHYPMFFQAKTASCIVSIKAHVELNADSIFFPFPSQFSPATQTNLIPACIVYLSVNRRETRCTHITEKKKKLLLLKFPFSLFPACDFQSQIRNLFIVCVLCGLILPNTCPRPPAST